MHEARMYSPHFAVDAKKANGYLISLRNYFHQKTFDTFSIRLSSKIVHDYVLDITGNSEETEQKMFTSDIMKRDYSIIPDPLYEDGTTTKHGEKPQKTLEEKVDYARNASIGAAIGSALGILAGFKIAFLPGGLALLVIAYSTYALRKHRQETGQAPVKKRKTRHPELKELDFLVWHEILQENREKIMPYLKD